jgi:hypothetical protein
MSRRWWIAGDKPGSCVPLDHDETPEDYGFGHEGCWPYYAVWAATPEEAALYADYNCCRDRKDWKGTKEESK